MRAVVLDGHGGPEVLTVAEVDDPAPGPDDVLVDVAASALNRADLLQRMGRYPGPPAEVEILGLEFAGTVAGVGERVRSWSPGDEVMGIVAGAGQAERVITHERALLRVPVGLGPAEAAAIPEVFMTAFDALVVQGAMTSGRWALVHAGASGVGTAAIQLMKAIGARVIVTASAPKLDACRRLGADVAHDYRAGPFADVVAEATGGEGVDCVLDVIGGEYLAANLDSLRVGGRVIQVGVMGQAHAELPLAKMLPKRATIIGTVLRSRPPEEKLALTQRFAAEVLPRFDDGALAPVIDRRFDIDDVADAHRYMESNANIGKICLDIAVG